MKSSIAKKQHSDMIINIARFSRYNIGTNIVTIEKQY